MNYVRGTLTSIVKSSELSVLEGPEISLLETLLLDISAYGSPRGGISTHA